MSHETPSQSCSTAEGESCCAKKCCGKALLYGFVVLGTLLIGAGLVQMMIHYTAPEPLAEDRAAFRKKNLAELRAANAEALTTYGWVDQTKGIVRLPIDDAMKLSIELAKNPEAARASLIARAEKAAAPAPKTPAKPGAFE